jgi:hypothetical protein
VELVLKRKSKLGTLMASFCIVLDMYSTCVIGSQKGKLLFTVGYPSLSRYNPIGQGEIYKSPMRVADTSIKKDT